MKGFIATILVLTLGLMSCKNDSQQQLEAQRIMQERIRIPDYGKMFIVAKAGLRSQLNIL